MIRYYPSVARNFSLKASKVGFFLVSGLRLRCLMNCVCVSSGWICYSVSWVFILLLLFLMVLDVKDGSLF